MKYRPSCAKLECGYKSDAVLTLPVFGPIYFCAAHTLANIIETERGI